MNFRIFKPDPQNWGILSQIADIDKQAFGLDGTSMFNNAQFARCGSLICMEKDNKIVAEAVVLKNTFDAGALLFGFAVATKEYNKGYGFLFLQEILKQCFSEGVKYFHLTMNPDNLAARKLYIEKAGFELAEILEPHPQKQETRWLLKLSAPTSKG